MRALDQAKLKPLIVERIAKGEFLEHIAKADGYPALTTIREWLIADSAFRLQCARAREASAEMFEQRVVELAAKVERGEIDPKAGAAAGNLLTWVCKVRNRRVYGDKVEVDATVSVGGAILERLARARGEVIEGDGVAVDAVAVDVVEPDSARIITLEHAA